jgi:hypothetical protein
VHLTLPLVSFLVSWLVGSKEARVGEGTADKVSPFRSQVDEVDFLVWTISFLSSHKQETSMPNSGKSHFPCSCCRDGDQSIKVFYKTPLLGKEDEMDQN